MSAGKYLDRAEQELAKKRYDQAIALFEQVIAVEPDNGPARAGKRRAEIAKFAKDYPSGLSRGLGNLMPRLMMGLGGLLRMHGMVANQAERALSRDPRNVKLNLALGHALLRAGHKNGAEAAFAVVTEFDRNDVESLKILGSLYYEAKKYDQSLDCYERVLKISPRDQEAVKMRKNLAAEGAIKSGGFEKASSARELTRSQDQLDQLEKRQKLVRSPAELGQAIAELEKEVAGAPQDADLQVRLGELRQQNRDLDGAARAFEAAMRLKPDDYDIAGRFGDCRLQALDQRVRSLRDEVAAGEDGAQDDLRRILKERRGFRIDEFRRRTTVHPTDTGLRMKLGQYLLDDNRIDDAIAEFQLVVKDPRRKHLAMVQMGKAFLRKGMGDLAVKQLGAALEGLGGINEKNLDIVRSLAEAHEEQGEDALALDCYTRIYEIDISYEGVADRIEVLRERLKSGS
ncbi:MAG: tetratricopeptide repeat protein [Planctomycetes bacterium]|nr:tetratricopeptide repeat protein [Planctomycetota bacterium]